MTLKNRIILNEQEYTANYDFFISGSYMTAGFRNTFGAEAITIVFTAIFLLIGTYPNNADYFQSFKYICSNGRETRFWIIHDVNYYTILLPEEY